MAHHYTQGTESVTRCNQSTVVRLASDPWEKLRHGVPLENMPRALHNDLRLQGKLRVRIILPPSEPDDSWTCGTKHVWRVHPESLAELGLPNLPFCVCEHQIEID